MILGKLAKAQPQTMGYGGISRRNKQSAQGQGDRRFGCKTRERSQHCQIYKCRGGEEEDRVDHLRLFVHLFISSWRERAIDYYLDYSYSTLYDYFLNKHILN